MDISIRGVIIFVVLAVGAYMIDTKVSMGPGLKTVFHVVCVIAAVLVLLGLFGVGPGVRIH